MERNEYIKLADDLHRQAQEEGSADLFEAAGNLYQKAGMTGKANKCWDAADACREPISVHDDVEQRR